MTAWPSRSTRPRSLGSRTRIPGGRPAGRPRGAGRPATGVRPALRGGRRGRPAPHRAVRDRPPQVLDAERYAPSSARPPRSERSGRGPPLLGPTRSPPACTRSGSPAGPAWRRRGTRTRPTGTRPAIISRSASGPVEPVTEDNGCMQFQPASNRLPVLDHQRVDPATEGLVLVDASPVTEPVVCPLPLGGATVHGGRALHCTGPNRSEEPRRALIMSFASPSRARVEPRSSPWQRSNRSD